MFNGNLIEFKNVTMRRGGRPVLSEVNWSVRSGEHWFIMGNNGSGKTTLLEILLGYLWPQQGEVRVFGERFGQTYLPDLRKRIGYVAPWIFRRTRDGLPVSEVVASGFEASIGYDGPLTNGMREAVDRQLAFFGCGELKDVPFGKLSSGQQFKAVLARALVHEPAILVLDEPFSLLDIGARLGTHRLLEDLVRHRPVQLILVTHHLEDLTPLYTHGLFLRDGRMMFQGPRDEVLTAPHLSAAFGADVDIPPAGAG